jgi:hypothetical protein
MTTQYGMPHWNAVADELIRAREPAGDHDAPYRFGCRPTSPNPWPFNTRQYVRLLVLRSRVQEPRSIHQGD